MSSLCHHGALILLNRPIGDFHTCDDRSLTLCTRWRWFWFIFGKEKQGLETTQQETLQSANRWLMAENDTPTFVNCCISDIFKKVTCASNRQHKTRLVGLGVWFSLWVREVPGSNPGWAHQFLSPLFLVVSSAGKKWSQGTHGFEPWTYRTAADCSTTELYPHMLKTMCQVKKGR